MVTCRRDVDRVTNLDAGDPNSGRDACMIDQCGSQAACVLIVGELLALEID